MHILTNDNAPMHKGELLHIINSLKNGATLPNSIIGDMMLSLLPKPPSKAKTAAKWVASAVAVKDNDPRPVLKLLWAIDGMLYASDGHRLHRIATDLPDGCYDPKTLAPVASDDLKPYRFNEIFNSFDHRDAKLFLPSELTRVISNSHAEPLGKVVSLVHPSIGFLCLERYFLQATNGEKGTTISISNDGQQLYGQSAFGDYVVMLTRFDINDFRNAQEI